MNEAAFFGFERMGKIDKNEIFSTIPEYPVAISPSDESL
jgi:hypothetical protein